MGTFERNTTCLVTGGCGSIGTEIVRQLIKRGGFKQIRLFDNRESALADSEIRFGKSEMRYFIGDIRDRGRLDTAMEGVDYVSATGVTNGEYLKGVRFFKGGAITHSVVMRSASGTRRMLETRHRFEYRPDYS